MLNSPLNNLGMRQKNSSTTRSFSGRFRKCDVFQRAVKGFGIHKYVAIAGVAARQALLQRATIFGRIAFLGLILFVFSRLWEVVLGQSPVEAAHARNMLWYLAITEWVLMSIPSVYLDVEKDIRSGDIVYRLPRPACYLAAQIAEGIGALAVRSVFLGTAGFAFAYLLAGGLPDHPLALLVALPMGLAAAGLGTIMYCAIGLMAIWFQDVSPIYWVWQKLAFVFGGLLIPLDFYPSWLRTAAEFTPFHALLYGSGRMALGCNGTIALDSALRLAAWTGIAILVLVFIYRKGLRELSINGG